MRPKSAILLLMFATPSLHALDADKLRQEIVAKVAQQIVEIYGRDATSITPAPLAAAVYERPCDAYALQISQANSRRLYGRVPVLVRCQKPQAWSVYTNVQVDLSVPVLVAAKALTRGERLNQSSVALKQMPIQQSRDYYLSNIEDIVGKVTRRSIRAGQPVSLNQLAAVDTVSKGDRVMIQSGNRRVQIHTYGEALTAGQFGDQIQVRNERSKRIIKPWVWGPGHVALRPPS